MKKKPSCPAWFRSLASELARRNTGAIDVSVAQTSEILGHLCDRLVEKGDSHDLFERLWNHGMYRFHKIAAAAKRKK